MLDLAHEIKIQNAVRDLIRAGLVKSAHDCSEGGLAVALAECCFNPEGRSARKSESAGERPSSQRRSPPQSFSTNRSRASSFRSRRRMLETTMSMLRERDVPFQQLGKVGGDAVANPDRGRTIRLADRRYLRRLVELDPPHWWKATNCAEGIPSYVHRSAIATSYSRKRSRKIMIAISVR